MTAKLHGEGKLCKIYPIKSSWQPMAAVRQHSFSWLTPTSCAGSGKTHTLVGDLDSTADRGLLTRAVDELAKGISNFTDGSEFLVRLANCTCWRKMCSRHRDLLAYRNSTLSVTAN